MYRNMDSLDKLRLIRSNPLRTTEAYRQLGITIDDLVGFATQQILHWSELPPEENDLRKRRWWLTAFGRSILDHLGNDY